MWLILENDNHIIILCKRGYNVIVMYFKKIKKKRIKCEDKILTNVHFNYLYMLYKFIT